MLRRYSSNTTQSFGQLSHHGGSVYGGHHFDMSGLPEWQQEILEADLETLESVDNFKVLCDYGIIVTPWQD